MKHGSLFSGIGGFERGAELSGIETSWCCEISQFNREVLKKHFPETKQYNDIRSLTGPARVDIISGGFPCQDISIANHKAQGIKGSRSGLWSEMFRVIREIRPGYVIIENSPALLIRGFERVLCDLSEIGFNAEWQCLSATTFGIQQRRERVYCIAYPNNKRLQDNCTAQVFSEQILQRQLQGVYPGFRTRRDIPEPRTYRVGHGIPDWVDRTKALGNAVIPMIAHYLFECIKAHHERTK